MSIESLLTKLTAAVIANTAALANGREIPAAEPDAVPEQKQLSSTAPPAPDADAAAATQSPTPTAEEKAPTPPGKVGKVLTGQELNDILKKEFTRIGSVRDPIDAVMKKLFDVDSLTNLKPEDYGQLVSAVAEIPSV